MKDTNEGRRHLNFSEWGSYPPGKAEHKLEEIAEYVEEGEMPLKVYLPLHSEARLSEEDRAALVAWAKGEREKLLAATADGESE